MTLAGMRPRSLISIPCSLARVLTSALLRRPAGDRPPRGALTPAELAGVLDERRSLRAEPASVRGAQVDLVRGRADTGTAGFPPPAPVEIIFERDAGPGRHLDLPGKEQRSLRHAGTKS
jgi:hypothetical protein